MIMEIGKLYKEFKMESTVKEYIKVINSYGSIHEKQIKFAEQLTDSVYNDNNKEKVNVNIARCGMGKSVIIKAILNNLVNKHTLFGKVKREDQLETFGAIVVTDSIERLEDISQSKGLKDRCYLMKFNVDDTEVNCRINFKNQIEEQFKFPILLMTTQKYFKMSEKEREFMYSWAKGKREVCFMDEKPILYNEIIVDEAFLSEIRIALHNCYEGEDKIYLLDTFDKIYNDLDYIRKNYSNSYDTMWIKKSKKTLLFTEDEDNKFFNVLANNVSNYIYNNVEELRRIYTDGCLFISNKSKEQDNIRQFIILNDNSNKFDTKKCKYHILDATAKNDIDYLINKDMFNYIEIDDKKEVKDINIHHITFSTSQRRLRKEPDAITAICNWINNNFDNNVFISTYGKKRGIFQQFEKQLNTENIAYYGAIKGKNDWQDKNEMVHIGFNRQSDIVYLLTYVYIRKKYNDWNEMDNEKIKDEIDNLLNTEKGIFKNMYMQEIMRSKILVDTEQNIMRIRCRHFSNEVICNIYIVAGEYYNFAGNGYITRLCDKLNANLFTYLPNEFVEYVTDSRKPVEGKERTNPQLLKGTLENIEKGTVIKMKDIIGLSGLTRDQIKECKKSNPYIKTWFELHKGEKNGSYVV